jgi:hypothetical protein
MKLPNGVRADLGSKLEEYVMNPRHQRGRHKARVFESVLGISIANLDILRQALRDAAATADDVEARGDDGFGEVYVLRFRLVTDKGAATVVSAWIVRRGEDFPRLTTCYIE